jgi:inward rectifier potassium channel
MTRFEEIEAMLNDHGGRTERARVVRIGGREIVAEGQQLSFWADISHRCMTASWPSFIAGAAFVFVTFNAIFAVLYWIGDDPISNVPHRAYIDYVYFSIETLSTAGYGDMHPQTHYGHFIAGVELFTGIFSMSVMTGLIFSRFSRPRARLLFANSPVISDHEDKPTLMLRLVNERHNIISNATAQLWMYRDAVTAEGQKIRRFFALPLTRDENPVLALSWTLYHVVDERSPLFGLTAADFDEFDISLVVVVSGHDVVAAQTVQAGKSYQHGEVRFGHRYVDVLDTSENGRIKIDYGRFHDTFEV